MKKLVVGSSLEEASMNILKELGDVADVLVCNSPIVELEELRGVKNRLVIVASPHSSSAGFVSLSVHSPGNFGEAKNGGEPGKLGVAPALFLGEALRKLREIKERKGLKHLVTLEVTHHGPTFNLPTIFVELGSDTRGWRSRAGAKAAAETVRHLLDVEPEGEASIGVGGPHYAPKFTRLTLDGKNLGHICPKYALQWLDGKMLSQMIERTTPRPERLILEWKGIPSEHKKRVMNLAESSGLIIEKLR